MESLIKSLAGDQRKLRGLLHEATVNGNLLDIRTKSLNLFGNSSEFYGNTKNALKVK